MKKIFICLILLSACQFVYAQKLKVKEKKGKSALFYGSENVTGYIYDAIENDKDGKYKVRSENGWGLIRASGNALIACKYDTLIYNREYEYIVMEDGKYGVVSEIDEVLLEKKYEKLDHYSNGDFLAKIDGAWSLSKGGQVTTDWESFVFKKPEQPPLYDTCSPSEIKEGKTDRQCSQQSMLMKVYGAIKYPAMARKKGVEGTCVIKFVIDKNGKAGNFELVRDIGAGCGEESLRVVKQLQNWTPAQEGGINVATEFHFPIKFKLQ